MARGGKLKTESSNWMAYAHFLVPAEGGDAEKRLQDFLRTHAVIRIKQRFVDNVEGAFWAYAVHYDELPGSREASGPQRELGKDRIDYQKTLSETDFALYVKLRDWRKEQAEAQGVPPFSIFHNATLAAIAVARPGTMAGLREISGVGEGKAERYGEAVLKIVAGTGTGADAATKPDQESPRRHS